MTEFLDSERIEECSGCGSPDILTFRKPDIGECRACDLLFRNPRPTQAEIARSYNTGATFETWQEQELARAAMWRPRHD
jgi:hypothetical protein